MAKEITVRRTFPDDWELFRQVRLEALREAPWAFGGTHEKWAEASEDQWRLRLTDVPANWVASLEDEPVGLIGGMLPEPVYAQLISMWVAPSVRGRGVADELVRTMLGWARSQPGAERVELDVYEHNVAAQKLYLRHGFAFAGPETGQPQNERRMVLAL